MAERPIIFVSHSSEDNQLTRDLCAELAQPPDASQPRYSPKADFDILVDYDDLVAGQEWPKQLHEWLARSNAAVILLTANAVASPWVLKEATILAWRMSLQSSFHLFTVRYPEVTDEQLTAAGFDPLALGNIQRVGAETPAQIAQTIRDTLGTPAPEPTQFDQLVGRLADLFGGAGTHTLRDVATRVRVDRPAWRPDRDLNIQYAEEVARQILNGSLGGFGGASELIDALSVSAISEGNVRKILRIVCPYWVDAAAAGKLPPLTTAQPRRAAAMNGAEVSEFTAQMYLYRAYPLSRQYTLLPVAGGQSGDPVKHYTDEICSAYRRRKNIDQDNDKIIARLKRGLPTYYVVLPPPLLDRHTLDQLLELFPKVTFILWTGERLERDETVDCAVWLEPEVDLDVEQEQLAEWEAADDIVRNMTA